MRRAILVAVGLCWLVAILGYPGWSSFDPVSTHFHPLHNYVCDLLSTQTPDGRNNTTSAIAMNLVVVLLVTSCLLPIWWQDLQAKPAMARLSRTLGMLACCATLLICIEQAFALQLPHGPLTLLAGVLALVPTALVLRDSWQQSHASPPLRVATLALLLAAGTNFVSYAVVQFGGSPTPVIPSSQNAALLLLLVWLWLWVPGRAPTND